MSPRQAIASSLHLFTVFSFFLAGLFFFALSFLPEIRIQMADFLLHHFEICTSIAFGFFLAAFLLFWGFYGLNRGKVLRIQMGRNLLSIESGLIEETIEAYFRTSFKGQISLRDVEILNGKKIEIGVSLTPQKKETQEELLNRAEKVLQTFLKERFGYIQSFDLIIKI